MENKSVKIIQPRIYIDALKKNAKPEKKKVCAYCRVSTDNEEQKTSYDAQVDEYTKRILENPNWQLVKIFADEGISGTSTKKRKEFNEMITAARNSEIDLILTKSFSRFARNTVNCLSYIRELRLLNVEIYFKKENIYSSDPKVDFLLTIMSSIAQEEARNISENVTWNVQKRFKEGVPVINTNRFLGYTKDRKGGNLVIIPEEAEVVKTIFQLYTNGVGPNEICRKLMAKGYKTGAGKTKWTQSTLTSILKNEKYCGDLIQQKSVTIDYLSHKRVKNKELAPKFHIENNHEPIIDKNTFLLAQKIRNDRADKRGDENKNYSKYTKTYPFSSLIVCNRCGRTLKRRYWNYGYPSARIMQQCGGYLEGKGNCNAKAVYQEVLEGATIQMLNIVFIKNINVMNTIQSVIEATIKVSDVEIKINTIRADKEVKETLLENLVDMKMKNPSFADSLFNAKYQVLSHEINKLNFDIQKLETVYMENYNTKERLLKIKEVLNSQSDEITDIQTDVLRAFIHKIIAVEYNEIIFCIAGTKSYSDQEFVEKRKEFIKYEPIATGEYYYEKYNQTMAYKVIVI